MEDYAAADERPLDRCLNDVAACDIYVGIFAWRYGSIPQKDNPDKKSITELEYRKASELNKVRLLFLLHNDAPWPHSQMEEGPGGKRIVALRNELSGSDNSLMISFFHNHEELARLVSVAVSLAESTTRQRNWMLPETLRDVSGLQLGSSLEGEIAEQISRAISDLERAEVFIVDLGIGKSWWSTRLYLLAALTADFTKAKQLVFVQNERFIGMSSPYTIRKILAKVHPEVEIAYYPAALLYSKPFPDIVFRVIGVCP